MGLVLGVSAWRRAPWAVSPHPLSAPCRPLGAGPSFGPLFTVPLLPAPPPLRRAARGGGPAGAGGGGPGQRLVVGGQRVSRTTLPRASVCPALLAHADRSRARGLSRLLDRG